MRKIVVNMLGTDGTVYDLIPGVNKALSQMPEGYSLVLVGPKDILEKEIKYDVEIIDASYDIKSNTNPTDMMAKYTDCALMKSYDYLKKDGAALVTASGTGCVFVGALFKIGLVENIKSAVLACDLLSKDFQRICVLDLGANIDCKANQLYDFARIGNAFMKSYHKVENPRIGLANLGSEPKKGTQVLKNTYEMLEQSDLNFVGNIEFFNSFSSTHDVLVCDGLIGNAILKNAEQMYRINLEYMQKYNVYNEEMMHKLYLLFDYNDQGGSFILGINKVVVKMHGGANSNTIWQTINQAIELDKSNFIDELKKEFSK